MKKCSKCQLEKPFIEFNKAKKRRFGLSGWCRECLKNWHRNYYLEGGKERYKKYVNKNKERIANQKRIYRKAHIEHLKQVQFIWRLKHLYNLTEEEYYGILKKQNYLCFICHKERKLVIDHSHKTGKVRALICKPCNRLVGKDIENISLLERAIEYLKLYDE